MKTCSASSKYRLKHGVQNQKYVLISTLSEHYVKPKNVLSAYKVSKKVNIKCHYR